jgi:hypothetical protein
MCLRPELILEDTTIILKDGTQFRTRYDVPVSMQVKIHIPHAEKSALSIKEQFSMQDFKLPNSDNLPLGVSEDCLEAYGTYEEIEESGEEVERSHPQSHHTRNIISDVA